MSPQHIFAASFAIILSTALVLLSNIFHSPPASFSSLSRRDTSSNCPIGKSGKDCEISCAQDCIQCIGEYSDECTECVQGRILLVHEFALGSPYGTCQDPGFKCEDPGFQVSYEKGKKCRDRNECGDVHDNITHQCKNGGKCLNTDSGYICQCVNGFKGRSCEIPPFVCSCDTKEQCICSAKYFSYFPKQCARVVSAEDNLSRGLNHACSCVHRCDASGGGYCTHHVGETSGHCACEALFVEPACDPNPCSADPCSLETHGESCRVVKNSATNRPTGYQCSCRKGWMGVNCRQSVDECASNPCKNGGICIDNNNGYTCKCLDGYDPKFDCVKPLLCINDPCKNDGKCIVNPQNGKVSCDCTNLFEGDFCDQRVNETIDECSSDPCQNGGSCTDFYLSWECNCRNGFTGERCEKTCPKGKSGPDCLCSTQAGKWGALCLPPIDMANETMSNPNTTTKLKLSKHCPPATCRGTCIGPNCVCNTGWSGPKCMKWADGICSSSVCKSNGGQCLASDEPAKTYIGQPIVEIICTCPACKTGGSCELQNPCCDPSLCSKNSNSCVDSHYAKAHCSNRGKCLVGNDLQGTISCNCSGQRFGSRNQLGWCTAARKRAINLEFELDFPRISWSDKITRQLQLDVSFATPGVMTSEEDILIWSVRDRIGGKGVIINAEVDIYLTLKNYEKILAKLGDIATYSSLALAKKYRLSKVTATGKIWDESNDRDVNGNNVPAENSPNIEAKGSTSKSSENTNLGIIVGGTLGFLLVVTIVGIFIGKKKLDEVAPSKKKMAKEKRKKHLEKLRSDAQLVNSGSVTFENLEVDKGLSDMYEDLHEGSNAGVDNKRVTPRTGRGLSNPLYVKNGSDDFESYAQGIRHESNSFFKWFIDSYGDIETSENKRFTKVALTMKADSNFIEGNLNETQAYLREQGAPDSVLRVVENAYGIFNELNGLSGIY